MNKEAVLIAKPNAWPDSGEGGETIVIGKRDRYPPIRIAMFEFAVLRGAPCARMACRLAGERVRIRGTAKLYLQGWIEV
jgi:hypothetical protein